MYKKTNFPFWLTLSLSLMSMMMVSCASKSYKPKAPPKLRLGNLEALTNASLLAESHANAQAEIEAWWKGDGITGKPKIVISIDDQKAYFYKDEEIVGVSSVSTGDESHPTPKGTFTLLDKKVSHRSSQYGDYVDASGNVVVANVTRRSDRMPAGTKYRGSNMPYFMRFNHGIGMHAGFLPGYPASHGCVRMPDHMAEVFYQNAPLGTLIVVK